MSLQFPATQRPFRLQFSLRLLLLLTALVAVGLAIYRWPWETTAVDSQATYTYRFHRGWNGDPVKHGRQTVVDLQSKQKTYETTYEEGVLRREQKFDAQGKLWTDKVHFPERAETWEQVFDAERTRSVVLVTKIKDHGRLRRLEWRTSAGKLLESMEYEILNDSADWKQVLWNDRPMADAVRDVLLPLPRHEQEFWAQPGWLSNQQVSADLGDATFSAAGSLLYVDSSSDNPLFGIPLGGRANYFLCPTSSTPHGPLIHELLSHAHARHQTLQSRFGILCMVPINAETAAPGDPTGTLAVHFTDTTAWLENVVGMDQRVASRTERLQQFFRDTGIEIDASQVVATPRPDLESNLSLPKPANFSPRINYLSQHAPRRTRRDTLGIFLWHHRLRVEQQGNKLVVRSRT